MNIIGGVFMHDFPRWLYGIQIWRIGRQIMQFESWMLRHKVPHSLAMLVTTPVEDHMNCARGHNHQKKGQEIQHRFGVKRLIFLAMQLHRLQIQGADDVQAFLAGVGWDFQTFSGANPATHKTHRVTGVYAIGEHNMVALGQRLFEGFVFGNKCFLRLGIGFRGYATRLVKTELLPLQPVRHAANAVLYLIGFKHIGTNLFHRGVQLAVQMCDQFSCLLGT